MHTRGQICCVGRCGCSGCGARQLAVTFHLIKGTLWCYYSRAVCHSFWSSGAGVTLLSLVTFTSRRSAFFFDVWTRRARISPISTFSWLTGFSHPWLTLLASWATWAFSTDGSLVPLLPLFPLVTHHIWADGELRLTHSWEADICFKGASVIIWRGGIAYCMTVWVPFG